MIPTSFALARRRPDMTSAAFLAIAFLTGIAGALQLPTLSLFLSQEVEARPFMVGLFYTGSAVIGIFVSQFLAVHSDKHGDRKIMIFNGYVGVKCCTSNRPHTSFNKIKGLIRILWRSSMRLRPW